MRFHRVRQPGIKWHATIVQSQENLTLHCTNKMCGTKNYSHTVPPPWKGFSLPPLPTKLNTFNLIFWPLRDPPPPNPQKFSIPSAGGIWVFSRTTQYDDRIDLKFLWSTHSKYWSNKTRMLFSDYVNFLRTTVIQVVIYWGTVTQKYLILVKTQCVKSGIYVIILRLSSWKPLFIPLSIVLLSNETFPEI